MHLQYVCVLCVCARDPLCLLAEIAYQQTTITHFCRDGEEERGRICVYLAEV